MIYHKPEIQSYDKNSLSDLIMAAACSNGYTCSCHTGGTNGTGGSTCNCHSGNNNTGGN